MNAWIWSTIFHTRDKPWTEIFDYIAAISLVFSQFACCLVRVGYRTRYRRVSLVSLAALVSFFLYHAYYLLFVKMDFGYNMTVNICVGLLNVICWLIWSGMSFLSGRVYVWPCALSVILAMAFAALELADFPPIAWTIDAHSLWHLSTVILPILWYRFVVADSKQLLAFHQ
jgi:post-GPI attachment to proteins factor 3